MHIAATPPQQFYPHRPALSLQAEREKSSFLRQRLIEIQRRAADHGPRRQLGKIEILCRRSVRGEGDFLRVRRVLLETFQLDVEEAHDALHFLRLWLAADAQAHLVS